MRWLHQCQSTLVLHGPMRHCPPVMHMANPVASHHFPKHHFILIITSCIASSAVREFRFACCGKYTSLKLFPFARKAPLA